MNRIIRVLMFLGLLSALMAAPVGAQDEGPIEPLEPAPSAETGELTQESISAWFVELPSRPIADGGSRSTILAEQQNFRAAAGAVRLQYTERFAYQTLWNGLSISLGPSQLGALSRVSGV
ncbi:MAG: S8 family serine peptidase, partial [Anaerolineales bacterium]